MAKDYLVEFTDVGARVIKDPQLIAEKKGQENVLLNPILPKGISPALWVKNGNTVDVLPFQKREERLSALQEVERKKEFYIQYPKELAEIEADIIELDTKLMAEVHTREGLNADMSAKLSKLFRYVKWTVIGITIILVLALYALMTEVL